MENQFKILECHDDDVISFDQELLKYKDFKNKLKNKFLCQIDYLFEKDSNDQSTTERLFNLILTPFGKLNLSINLNSPLEGEKAEILRLGSNKWEKGKIRTKLVIEFLPEGDTVYEGSEIRMSIEFSPDEPETICQSASPLDDLRRQIQEIT
ncbi:KGK domain-containing protein [Calothrix sp. PCC 6303]|uniref:KGK domain-containing protein n=1 Tax=Calothrix sp. PCC 6303 TaxID=1170562 RepID=UPI0002A042E4|nr:KGK domain-containing protein [Calothrix sp. PCC 6303]AFZ01911.1 KGK family protein [Calothrix sp. PCC 6303]